MSQPSRLAISPSVSAAAWPWMIAKSVGSERSCAYSSTVTSICSTQVRSPHSQTIKNVLLANANASFSPSSSSFRARKIASLAPMRRVLSSSMRSTLPLGIGVGVGVGQGRSDLPGTPDLSDDDVAGLLDDDLAPAARRCLMADRVDEPASVASHMLVF